MNSDPVSLLLYFIMGAAAAVIATMSGVGGGVFFVPMFSLLLGYPIPLAVGTSKGVVAVVTSFGSISYLREKLVNPSDALVIASSMIPSSIVGAFLVAYVEPRLIEVMVGVFVMLYGVRMLYRTFKSLKGGQSSSSQSSDVTSTSRRDTILKVVAGVIAGLVAGLTGTGGGAILVPILTTLLRMNLKKAVATSTLAIFPGSVAAALVHAATDTLVYSAWTLVAPGALMGAVLGPKIVSRIRIALMRPIVGIVLILVGIRLILS